MKSLTKKLTNFITKFIPNNRHKKNNNFFEEKPHQQISYDLFLSYSSNDREAIIKPLYNELQDENFQAWFDIKEIRWGDSIVKKMENGITNTKIVIFFISKSYLKSFWTLKELRSIIAIQQVTNDKIIFPILLGVSEKEIIESVPFLADIKHLKINDYNPNKKTNKKYFQEIIQELEKIKDNLKPLKLKQFFHVCTLASPIKVATFGSHYKYYSIFTSNESLKVNIYRALYPEYIDYSISKLPKTSNDTINLTYLVEQVLKKLNIQKIDALSSIASNPTHYPIFLITLNSGNIIITHKMHIIDGSELRPEDYIITNAPKNPSVSTLSRNSRESFLGYANGSIYIWNGKGHLLHDLQSPILAIDVSFESIFVAVTEKNEIGIWFRNSYQLKKHIRTENKITSLSVSKTRVRYSKNGIFTTGHKNGIVNSWDFEGTHINNYKVTDKPIIAMCFFPFGLEYLGIATHNSFKVLNIITGNIILSFSHKDGNITTLHIGETVGQGYGINPDYEKIYATIGCDNGKVFTWELIISALKVS
ncbi:MAG: Unknown protein [uncultured Sulfurovum sp.]|uniref:ADP-ribosyl cyclase/cyclic ADP-ribose hydrolase n=1 Tax=uncultured Sulfurovum sp. TaxID=269237 RepID=A0A6S6T8E6_9BACT|nr:MAG: Unknown protein [uncultured Sulfurovum sp.]